MENYCYRVENYLVSYRIEQTRYRGEIEIYTVIFSTCGVQKSIAERFKKKIIILFIYVLAYVCIDNTYVVKR